MAIGERIHFFRLLRGMTQKYLGMALGFPEKSADVRLAQYETGSRTPKADLTAALAQVLDVSPHALSVPDIDSYVGLMHTLFTLEDNYGLKISEMDGEVCLKVDVRKTRLQKDLWKYGYNMCGRARTPPGCMRCSVPGNRPLPCWRRAKFPKKITTSGATTIRSLIGLKRRQRRYRKNSAISWWKL